MSELFETGLSDRDVIDNVFSKQLGSLSPPILGGLTFIEQLHAVSQLFCPNPSVPYITGIKEKKVYLFRGSCKMWACPVCGARNGKKWLARMLEHMNNNSECKRWYFLTITAHKNARTPNTSLINIRQGWKKLYNRMRRKYGISEYVKVWEFHKDGTFHLHILIGRKIGKKWLKDNSAECGMGYICDSSKSKNAGQVAGYIAKYLIKSFQHADMYKKGMRRIEASRNWTKLPELSDDFETWIVHQTRDGQDMTVIHLMKTNDRLEDKRPSKTKESQIVDIN